MALQLEETGMAAHFLLNDLTRIFWQLNLSVDLFYILNYTKKIQRKFYSISFYVVRPLLQYTVFAKKKTINIETRF